MSKRTRAAVAAAVVGISSVGAIAWQVTPIGASNVVARAELRTAANVVVGEVVFKKKGPEIVGIVEVDGLPTGTDFRGFHIHANDVDNDPIDGNPADGCVGPAFTSVDGHWDVGGHSHGAHTGDLPVLMRDANGHAEARFTIGKFTPGDIIGRAVIVHLAADNYGNVPARYTHATGTGPDATTLANGDAGGRFACGVITSAPDSGNDD